MKDGTPRTAVTFDYTARDPDGARKKGRISAVDLDDAAQKLRAKGLYPIDIKAGQAVAPTKARKKGGPRKLNQRYRADMIARLAKLTSSQITLDRSLSIMADGKDGPLPAVATALRTHMREGGSFVDGLRDHLDLQDPATLALIRGAEISGDMSAALTTASEILQQRLLLVRRIGVGLLYPSLLLAVALISVGLIMIAVIPQFRPLVEDRMDMVPLLGRGIFALSATLTALWPVIVAASCAAFLALWLLHRKGKAMPLVMRIAARTPVISKVIKRNQVMIVLHALGALLHREVTLSTALRVVGQTTPDGPIKKALSGISKEVEGGQALSTAFAGADIMSSTAIEMVRIGEETGDLSGMIGRAASEMRDTADRELERFLALFQPALIVFVGLIVGVSLYALFSAIVSVNTIAF